VACDWGQFLPALDKPQHLADSRWNDEDTLSAIRRRVHLLRRRVSRYRPRVPANELGNYPLCHQLG